MSGGLGRLVCRVHCGIAFLVAFPAEHNLLRNATRPNIPIFFFLGWQKPVTTNDETSVSEKIKENPHGFFLSPLFFAISHTNFQMSIAEI